MLNKNRQYLFVYGTLLVPSARELILEKKNIKTKKAQLFGYKKTKGGKWGPMLSLSNESLAVDGEIFTVNSLDLSILDEFEGIIDKDGNPVSNARYKRITSQIKLKNGKKVQAYVYINNNPEVIKNEPWDLEEFKREKLDDFLMWIRNTKETGGLKKKV